MSRFVLTQAANLSICSIRAGLGLSVVASIVAFAVRAGVFA